MSVWKTLNEIDTSFHPTVKSGAENLYHHCLITREMRPMVWYGILEFNIPLNTV